MQVLVPGVSFDELDDVVTCSHAFPFSQREFAAEIYNNSENNDTVYYKRHLQFMNVALLWQWLQTTKVKSLHMGACKIGETVKRELVFDFDVTDMKDRCACACAEKRSACNRCWMYARVAMYCIASMLSDDFGVPESDMTWFYSGNRGFHCYVRSPSIAGAPLHSASNDIRRMIAERFVYISCSQQRLSIAQRRLLPSLRRFYTEHIYPTHSSVLGQAMAPELISDERILEQCWPKMDKRVTSDAHHLLRAPYTINPKSGRYVERITVGSIKNLLDYVPSALLVEFA